MELEYLVSKWKIARSKIDDWSVERKCIIADNFFFLMMMMHLYVRLARVTFVQIWVAVKAILTKVNAQRSNIANVWERISKMCRWCIISYYNYSELEYVSSSLVIQGRLTYRTQFTMPRNILTYLATTQSCGGLWSGSDYCFSRLHSAKDVSSNEQYFYSWSHGFWQVSAWSLGMDRKYLLAHSTHGVQL